MFMKYELNLYEKARATLLNKLLTKGHVGIKFYESTESTSGSTRWPVGALRCGEKLSALRL